MYRLPEQTKRCYYNSDLEFIVMIIIISVTPICGFCFCQSRVRRSVCVYYYCIVASVVVTAATDPTHNQSLCSSGRLEKFRCSTLGSIGVKGGGSENQKNNFLQNHFNKRTSRDSFKQVKLMYKSSF